MVKICRGLSTSEHLTNWYRHAPAQDDRWNYLTWNFMMTDKQHVQLPNEMGIDGLKPIDQLVYVILRLHMDRETYQAHVSLGTLAAKAGVTRPTITQAVRRLVSRDYVRIRKQGKRNTYVFNKLVGYEPFSRDFIDNTRISPETKAYIVASQQYMIKDTTGYGKISYSNHELASLINVSERAVRRYNRELEDNGLLTILRNKGIDTETGCKTETKVFSLGELGQAIVWVLRNHEERLRLMEIKQAEQEEAIGRFQEHLDKKDKLIKLQQKIIAELQAKKEEAESLDILL